MRKKLSFWRFVISVNWAKWTWTTTTEKEQITHLLSITIVDRDNNKALSLILGPLAVMISFI